MTKRIRGFEKISTFNDIQLPKRATRRSAGYDFECAADTVIPSVWQNGAAKVLKELFTGNLLTEDDKQLKAFKPTLVPTGIKSYMGEDEYLQLCNRSSNPLKLFLWLANGVGVIDSDYYNNPQNEGHIMFQFLNFGFKDQVIKKGERIGQGIFLPFLKADNDQADSQRTGGFGSSGN